MMATDLKHTNFGFLAVYILAIYTLEIYFLWLPILDVDS